MLEVKLILSRHCPAHLRRQGDGGGLPERSEQSASARRETFGEESPKLTLLRSL